MNESSIIDRPNRNRTLNREYEALHMKNIPYEGMVRIRTIGDGSCFFHALCNGFFLPYRTGKIENNDHTFKSTDKNQIVKNLREELSILLGSKINPEDPDSLLHYDVLSNGDLKEISRELPGCSLQNMQNELKSNYSIDNRYNEFISNVLNQDIYILDLISQDITGFNDSNLYKNRNSVVLLYIGNEEDRDSYIGHYELVGILQNDSIVTHFTPNHSFIAALQNRINSR